jgi:hypothetical protein
MLSLLSLGHLSVAPLLAFFPKTHTNAHKKICFSDETLINASRDDLFSKKQMMTNIS